MGMEVTMDPLAPFPSSLTLHESTHTMHQKMVQGAGPRGQEPVYGRNLGAQWTLNATLQRDTECICILLP